MGYNSIYLRRENTFGNLKAGFPRQSQEIWALLHECLYNFFGLLGRHLLFRTSRRRKPPIAVIWYVALRISETLLSAPVTDFDRLSLLEHRRRAVSDCIKRRNRSLPRCSFKQISFEKKACFCLFILVLSRIGILRSATSPLQLVLNILTKV